MIGNDLKNIIKLNHTNIVSGTVKFDIRKASVNSFIKEVDFINGYDEFSIASIYRQINNYNKNVIELQDGFIDDDTIQILGCSEYFKSRVYSEDELIAKGDWLISYENTVPEIILPEGVFTSDIVDTELVYNIQGAKVSISGLYSVDYIKGILHTVAPIDERIEISYRYSSIFAEYEALEKVSPQKITVSQGLAIVEDESEESSEYLAIIKNNISKDIDYKVSPVIDDLKVNFITSGDLL
jgi:hypothetical protein